MTNFRYTNLPPPPNKKKKNALGLFFNSEENDNFVVVSLFGMVLAKTALLQPQKKRWLESEAENLCAHFSVHFRQTTPVKRGLRSFIKRPL